MAAAEYRVEVRVDPNLSYWKDGEWFGLLWATRICTCGCGARRDLESRSVWVDADGVFRRADEIAGHFVCSEPTGAERRAIEAAGVSVR